mgnify:CR=1 FL=1
MLTPIKKATEKDESWIPLPEKSTFDGKVNIIYCEFKFFHLFIKFLCNVRVTDALPETRIRVY